MSNSSPDAPAKTSSGRLFLQFVLTLTALFIAFAAVAGFNVLDRLDLGLSPKQTAAIKAISACVAALGTLGSVVTAVARRRWAGRKPPAMVGGVVAAFVVMTAMSVVIVLLAVGQVQPPVAPAAPAAPEGLAFSVDAGAVTLIWLPSVDDTHVREYTLRRNGAIISRNRDIRYTDRATEAGQVYVYAVTALGDNGIESQATKKTVSIPTALPAPKEIFASITGANSVELVWEKVPTESPVSYLVFRNGAQVGETTSTLFTDITVAPDTAYTYTVCAYDARGDQRRSTPSPALSVRTQLAGVPPVSSRPPISRPPVVPQSSASGTAPATAPPSRVPTNTATIANITDGASTAFCVPLTGPADLSPDTTLLTAQRRITDNDVMYYYQEVWNVENGQWRGQEYLGDEVGQKYDIYVFVMDTAGAKAFFDSHASADGLFAFADKPPPNVIRTTKINVTQTSLANCA